MKSFDSKASKIVDVERENAARFVQNSTLRRVVPIELKSVWYSADPNQPEGVLGVNPE
jgi:hypothetical protein